MTDLRNLSLLDLVPALSPELSSPTWLSDWCTIIESCLVGGVRALMAVPIRHGKTETTLHGISWLLLHDPTINIILLTFDHERAEYLGWRARQICEVAGVPPEKGSNKKIAWRVEQGGGVIAMSAGQSKLGYDCDVLIFDDPLDELSAYDKTVRDAVDGAIVHYTARVGRPGRKGSVLGIMSRWHDDDPFGRRKSRKARDWQVIEHPAITVGDDGQERAFAPNVMTLEELHERREELREADPGERIWWAQFQNNPRPDVQGLFGQPATYAMPPAWGRYVIGIDLAYSKESSADYFAMVVLKVWEKVAYVVNVWREKRDLDSACARIRQARGMYPSASVFSYVAGPEIGAVHYLNDRGIPCVAMHARYDKGTRARKTIDAWNLQQIQVPEQAPWVAGFVHRCKLFTGHPKAFDDDEIDALVSAYDGGVLAGGQGAPSAFGKPRISRY